jgi:hypothetical protein
MHQNPNLPKSSRVLVWGSGSSLKSARPQIGKSSTWTISSQAKLTLPFYKPNVCDYAFKLSPQDFITYAMVRALLPSTPSLKLRASPKLPLTLLAARSVPKGKRRSPGALLGLFHHDQKEGKRKLQGHP